MRKKETPKITPRSHLVGKVLSFVIFLGIAGLAYYVVREKYFPPSPVVQIVKTAPQETEKGQSPATPALSKEDVTKIIAGENDALAKIVAIEVKKAIAVENQKTSPSTSPSKEKTVIAQVEPKTDPAIQAATKKMLSQEIKETASDTPTFVNFVLLGMFVLIVFVVFLGFVYVCTD